MGAVGRRKSLDKCGESTNTNETAKIAIMLSLFMASYSYSIP